MILHVFEISLLTELRKFYFKPAGTILFYDTGLSMSVVCSCFDGCRTWYQKMLVLFFFFFFFLK